MVISEMVKQWRTLNDAHAEATDVHPHPGDGMITVYRSMYHSISQYVFDSMYNYKRSTKDPAGSHITGNKEGT